MPQYRRYGYVISKQDFEIGVGPAGRMVGAEVVGFLLNPKKAHEAVDAIIKSEVGASTSAKVVSDAMETVKTGLVGEVMRVVLIEYPNGDHSTLTLERWYVVVGKE